MTVWVVFMCYWDPDYICRLERVDLCGVYSTKEHAREAMEKLALDFDWGEQKWVDKDTVISFIVDDFERLVAVKVSSDTEPNFWYCIGR